jgi:aspartyl protease family protein
MLRFAVVFAALCCGFAFVTEDELRFAVHLIGADGPAPPQTPAAAPVAVTPPIAPAQASQPQGAQVLRPLAQDTPSDIGFRQARIAADGGGQYSADFFIDGVAVRGLIDTGATFMSLTPSTAQRLGIIPNRNGPRYQIRTANGLAYAWPVKLASVSFQGLYVKDVDAIVGEDEVGGNLIGESFLKRLQSVSQENGTLVLKQ